MKEYVKHIKTPSSITITWSKGDPTYISSDDKRFKKVNKLLFQEKYDKIIELLDVKETIKRKIQGSDFDIKAYDVYYKDEKLPETLAKKLIEFSKKEEDINYLAKFWEKLRQNPTPYAKENLFKFLDGNNIPITKNGNFICYKKVDENFKDLHTRSIDYSPGNVVQQDRGKCDPNPRNTCSTGLHVASHDYAWGFGGKKKLIKCEVNPKDVISVPNDYQYKKMRVCRLKVISTHGEKEMKGVTYKRKVKRRAKKLVSIVRIPAEKSLVYPNGKGTIRIPIEILSKFNVMPKDTLYGVPKDGSVVIYMRKDDALTTKNKLPKNCIEVRVGKECGFVSAKLRDAAGLGIRKSYSIRATKGTLVVE